MGLFKLFLAGRTVAAPAAGDEFARLDAVSGNTEASTWTQMKDDVLTDVASQYATVSSGAGAPVSTPTKVGDIYVDTTNDDAYIAVGTASSADWEKSNDGAGAGSTDLAWIAATSTVTSSSGTDATLTAVDGTNPGLMTVALKSKLDGIEAGADVTDTANVTAAGALMDSEVDADIKTLSLPPNTTISAFGATLVDDADQSAAQTTLGLVPGTNVQAYDADLADIAAIADQQGDIIVRGASGWERLAKSATSTDVLTAGASQPTWAAASGGSAYPTGAPDSTQYGLPGVQAATTSTYTPAGDRVHYMPIVVTAPITVQRVALEISATTAAGGSLGAIGIYDANSLWHPTTRVSAVGTVAIDSPGAKIISSLSISLPAGRYLLSFNSNSSLATYRTARGAPGDFTTINAGNQFITVLFAAQTYATAPSTPTDWSSVSYDTAPLHQWLKLTWTVD